MAELSKVFKSFQYIINKKNNSFSYFFVFVSTVRIGFYQQKDTSNAEKSSLIFGHYIENNVFVFILLMWKSLKSIHSHSINLQIFFILKPKN